MNRLTTHYIDGAFTESHGRGVAMSSAMGPQLATRIMGGKSLVGSKDTTQSLSCGDQNSSMNPRFAEVQRAAIAPLSAPHRKPGKDVDFFIQALITGAMVVVVPVVVGLVVLGNYALPYLR